MIEVTEYTTGMGHCPYRQYLISVRDKQAANQIIRAVTRMEAGLLKNVRSLRDGLQECKVDAGEGHRIYFYRDGQTLIVLLAASSKKDQEREIDRARNYLEDYKRQKRQSNECEENTNEQKSQPNKRRGA